MKKALLITVIISFTCYAGIKAQTTWVGGGICWGHEAESAGLGLTSKHRINNDLGFSPGINFFFPTKEGPYWREVTTTWFTFNGDFQYYFEAGNNLFFYPLGGLNISIISSKIQIKTMGMPSTIKDSNAKMGINLGMGGQFELKETLFSYFEIKYVAITDIPQFVVSAGVLFALD
jgi:hypothetical protein